VNVGFCKCGYIVLIHFEISNIKNKDTNIQRKILVKQKSFQDKRQCRHLQDLEIVHK